MTRPVNIRLWYDQEIRTHNCIRGINVLAIVYCCSNNIQNGGPQVGGASLAASSAVTATATAAAAGPPTCLTAAMASAAAAGAGAMGAAGAAAASAAAKEDGAMRSGRPQKLGAKRLGSVWRTVVGEQLEQARRTVADEVAKEESVIGECFLLP